MGKTSYEFLKLLSKPLETEGYKLVKSRNTFVQKFEHGSYNILISFSGRPLLWLDYGIYASFDKIEKYIKNNGLAYSNKLTVKYWNLIFKAQRINNIELNKELYDSEYKYTEASLNRAHTIFNEHINPLIHDFKSKVFDYKSLYQFLKTDRFYSTFYSNNCIETIPNRINKKIIQRLILTYNFDKELYVSLMDKYRKLYDAYKCEFSPSNTEAQKKEWREEALRTLQFLNENMLILDR